MHAHKSIVTILSDHQVVVRLPDDFPAGEAEVIVLERQKASAPSQSLVEFDRFLASLPAAPVVSLDSLDRSELYR
jgi:hypothetical protein